MLLFANDLLFIDTTKNGLQTALHNLQRCSIQYKLRIFTSKMKVMAFLGKQSYKSQKN